MRDSRRSLRFSTFDNVQRLEAISEISGLEVLNLDDCGLSGNVPEWIYHMESLQHLYPVLTQVLEKQSTVWHTVSRWSQHTKPEKNVSMHDLDMCEEIVN